MIIIAFLGILIGLSFLAKPQAFFRLATSQWRALGDEVTPSKRTYFFMKVGGVVAIISGIVILIGQII